MIHDLDDSVRNLLERDVINGSGIDLDFASPTKEWAGKLNGPTINVFLYDIREELSRRDVMFEEVRDDNGRVIERRQPPRQFRYGYLVTAWTKRPEDEHRLLASVLGCLVQHDRLPPAVLAGSLEGSERPVITQVGLALEQDRQYSNIWGAVGGELKPAINLVCIAPFDVSQSMPVGPPVTEEPRITVGRPDTDETEEVRPRRGGVEPDEHEEPVLASETIRGGAEDEPGRVVRMAEMPRRR